MKKINIYNVEVRCGAPVSTYTDADLLEMAKSKQANALNDFTPEKTVEVEDDIAQKRVSLVLVQNVDSHHAAVTWADYADEEEE